MNWYYKLWVDAIQFEKSKHFIVTSIFLFIKNIIEEGRNSIQEV